MGEAWVGLTEWGEYCLIFLSRGRSKGNIYVKIRLCYDVWNRMGQGLGSALLEKSVWEASVFLGQQDGDMVLGFLYGRCERE